jgi:hypothetical protein
MILIWLWMREGMSGRELVIVITTGVPTNGGVIFIIDIFDGKSDAAFFVKCHRFPEVVILFEKKGISLLKGVGGYRFTDFERQIPHFNFPP